MGVEHHLDRPGGSITDQVAGAAFDTIDEKLAELGVDPRESWSVVMVLVPDGQPQNATVAGHLPGEPTTERLLEHAVTQLSVLARECGYEIRLEAAVN